MGFVLATSILFIVFNLVGLINWLTIRRLTTATLKITQAIVQWDREFYGQVPVQLTVNVIDNFITHRVIVHSPYSVTTVQTAIKDSPIDIEGEIWVSREMATQLNTGAQKTWSCSYSYRLSNFYFKAQNDLLEEASGIWIGCAVVPILSSALALAIRGIV